MYEFRTRVHANLMVGSANLSERALIFNSEAATIHTAVPNLKALNGTWKRLQLGASVVNASLIAAYSAARAKYPPPSHPPIPSPTSVPAQSLWDATISGAAQPADYEYFWVDAHCCPVKSRTDSSG
jgi:hypothetical protein